MRTLLLLAALTSSAAANDDKLGYPVPAAFPTPDGRHLLVLIPPKSDAPTRKENPLQQGLRAKYPQGSGLYTANDTTPLWPVDWFAYEAFPADDARSVVRFHGDYWLTREFKGKRLPEEAVAEQLASPAVSFYRDGKLLKTYSVREIVADPERLPHTMKHILWSAGATVTADGTRFVLMTQDSRQLIFELETGNLLTAKRAGLGDEASLWAVRVGMGLTAVGLAFAVGMWLYFNKFSRPSETGARPATAPAPRPSATDG